MNRTLYIRADADTVMGTGHVMRCLALGQEWRRSVKGPVVFMSRMDSRPLQERVKLEGFSIVAVPAVCPDARDMDFVNTVLSQDNQDAPTWLVLDGYHFDRSYQERALVSNRRLLVIDDNSHLPDYCCDLLLNQNIDAEQLKYQGRIRMKKLFGPRYALLRPEFRQSRDDRQAAPKIATKILITLGGSDRQNTTGCILRALAELPIDGLWIKAVVGPANPHAAALSALAAQLPRPIELFSSSNDMAGLMQWADVAVTAAGTTIYELAASGLPFITVVIADNQERNAAKFAEHGIAPTFGRLETVRPGHLAASLLAFLGDQQQRNLASTTGRKLVDGRGAERVVAAMKAGALVLRPVQSEDGDLLLEWANNPQTRENSFQAKTISRNEHQRWLKNKLGDRDCRMYMVQDQTENPLGVVRFDLSGNSARISVNLAPSARGNGIGGLIIVAACNALFQERTETTVVEALIKEKNASSLRAFAKAGFMTIGAMPQGNIPAIGMRYHRSDPEAA